NPSGLICRPSWRPWRLGGSSRSGGVPGVLALRPSLLVSARDDDAQALAAAADLLVVHLLGPGRRVHEAPLVGGAHAEVEGVRAAREPVEVVARLVVQPLHV